MCTVSNKLLGQLKHTIETVKLSDEKQRYHNGNKTIYYVLHVCNHIFSEELYKLYYYVSMPLPSVGSNEHVPITSPICNHKTVQAYPQDPTNHMRESQANCIGYYHSAYMHVLH